MEPMLQKYVERLSSELQKHKNEVIDLNVHFLAWTTDLVADRLFHQSIGLFGNPIKSYEWYQGLRQFAIRHPLSKHFPWLITLGVQLPLAASQLLQPSMVSSLSVYKVGKDVLNQSRPFSEAPCLKVQGK